MIRICFRHGDSRWFSRLICLARGGDSAHCEVGFNWWDGQTYECVSSSWVDGGVRDKVIRMPPEKWRVYEVPGDKLDAHHWLEQHRGENYGWAKLVRFAIGLRLRWGGPVCSGVCADIMRLPEPWLYDVRLLESVCARYGARIQ